MTKEECLAYINSNPDISPYTIQLNMSIDDLNHQQYVLGLYYNSGTWTVYNTDWRGESHIDIVTPKEDEAYKWLGNKIMETAEEKRGDKLLGFAWPADPQACITSFRGDYAFLSNFYDASVTYGGLTYRNSEAAFQAQKCRNEADKVAFTTMSPSDAKKAGKSIEIRDDWEGIKRGVMRGVVLCKFEQHEDIRRWLLNTGSSYLIEGNTWGDRTWGQVNGSGKNWLGLTLMEVRATLGGAPLPGMKGE